MRNSHINVEKKNKKNICKFKIGVIVLCEVKYFEMVNIDKKIEQITESIEAIIEKSFDFPKSRKIKKIFKINHTPTKIPN
ncbi:hypothetical protein GVAV_003261 [Gurleya vavrai]